jgi:hypothetical protein
LVLVNSVNTKGSPLALARRTGPHGLADPVQAISVESYSFSSTLDLSEQRSRDPNAEKVMVTS